MLGVRALMNLVVIACLFVVASEGRAKDKEKGPSRRVYVLHSGVHTILAHPSKNAVAEQLAIGLRCRGIAARDIVILPNPYPTASWGNMFPYECMTMFIDSATPGSKVSQFGYRRLHQALQARGVRKKDSIVWIGHSAGGQMGLTMAHLSRNLGDYPKLAKATDAYRFEMVITLGTPVASNHAPAGVKVRHYYSPADRIVRWVTQVGPLALKTVGRPLHIGVFPPNLRQGDLIRIFEGVDHAYWDDDHRVLDRILGEATRQQLPLWQASAVLGRSLDVTLLRMVAESVKVQSNIVLEDPPKIGPEQ